MPLDRELYNVDATGSCGLINIFSLLRRNRFFFKTQKHQIVEIKVKKTEKIFLTRHCAQIQGVSTRSKLV